MIVKHIPNLFSVARLILIIPFLLAFYDHHYRLAFSLFIIAGLTDGLDGWLARHFHLQSRLGHLMDPLADKLLVASSFISLALIHQLPWWLVILVFLRDITLFVGAAGWYFFVERSYEFIPTLLSKLNTALQILLVTLCLFNIAYQTLQPNPIPWLIYLTAITTTITYIDYVWTWGKKACLLKRT
jgi:cardiolipin synthase